MLYASKPPEVRERLLLPHQRNFAANFEGLTVGEKQDGAEQSYFLVLSGSEYLLSSSIVLLAGLRIK